MTTTSQQARRHATDDLAGLRETLAAATARAVNAEARLRLLTAATQAVSGVLDPVEAVQRLTQLAVPTFADWCLVALIEAPFSVVARHRDPALEPLTRAMAEHVTTTRIPSRPVEAVLTAGRPTRIAGITADQLEQNVPDPVLLKAYRAMGMRSIVIAPLWVRGRVIGNVSFVIADDSRAPYEEADEQTAAELAQRTALTLDNARLIAQERAGAEALQRSLLPELPEVRGLEIAAIYRTADALAQVGGDWYDVLPLPDGSVGLAVGDVMGHDLEAAAAMGQLRSVLRGYAWDGDAPSTVLSRLDRLVRGLGMAQLATCFYGRLRLGDGEPARLDYASAGHPPALLLAPDGTSRQLDAAADPMIGLPLDVQRAQASLELAPGSTLVLYTDGLVETRRRPADVGTARLQALLEAAPRTIGAAELCDLLLEGMGDEPRTDDVALLVLRVDPAGG